MEDLHFWPRQSNRDWVNDSACNGEYIKLRGKKKLFQDIGYLGNKEYSCLRDSKQRSPMIFWDYCHQRIFWLESRDWEPKPSPVDSLCLRWNHRAASIYRTENSRQVLKASKSVLESINDRARLRGVLRLGRTIWEDQSVVLRAHSRLEERASVTTQTRCPCTSGGAEGRNVGGSSIMAVIRLDQNHMLRSCPRVFKAKARGIQLLPNNVTTV